MCYTTLLGDWPQHRDGMFFGLFAKGGGMRDRRVGWIWVILCNMGWNSLRSAGAVLCKTWLNQPSGMVVLNQL